jgi:hypothetical protein
VDVESSDEQKYYELHTTFAENMPIISKLRYLVIYGRLFFLNTEKKFRRLTQ